MYKMYQMETLEKVFICSPPSLFVDCCQWQPTAQLHFRVFTVLAEGYQPTKQQVLSSDGAQVQLRRLSSSVAQHTSVDASVLLGRLLAPAQLNILTDFSLFRNFEQLMGA